MMLLASLTAYSCGATDPTVYRYVSAEAFAQWCLLHSFSMGGSLTLSLDAIC